MKVFISIDYEGLNSICRWDETENGDKRYSEFQKELAREVSAACRGAHRAGATTIVVKDAHDSARNLPIDALPDYCMLHRGWEGGLCSMMGGLDCTFDAVLFVGYHSPSRSNGNSLSHTMNTRLHHVLINGKIASEFTINSLYASSLNIPVAFLSGDLNLTQLVKEVNPNIEVVASKEGRYGAVLSKHPSITEKEIEDGVFNALSKNLSKNVIALPKLFDIEVQYKQHTDAYSNSFYPGCQLIGSDIVQFKTDNYYEVLRAFKFIL